MSQWALKLTASCLVGILSSPVSGYTATAPQDTNVLQTENQEAQDEIERLRQALSRAQAEIARLQKQLAAAQKTTPDEATPAPSSSSHAYRDTLAALTRQIDANPQTAELYAKRGMVHTHLGEYAQALDDLNRAIGLEPQAATIYNQRGVVHYQLGQHTRALQDFDDALVRAPDLEEAYHNRGIVYQTLGDYPQAYTDLRRAADLGLPHAAETLQKLRSDIRRLQNHLRQAGLAPGPIDGVPGTQTVAALQAYQRRQGLPATGQLDGQTRQALGMRDPKAAPSNPTPDILSRFVKRPTPPYPVQARQQGWEGKVTLRFEMLANGTIGTIEVVNSSGHTLLDTVAQDTLQTWTHQPIVQAGQAVTQWATLDFEFKLEDNTSAAP